MSKRCCRCKTEKPATDFWPSQIRCKDCCRAYGRTEAARENNRNAHKQWYAENREQVLADAKRWRAQNYDRYRAWQKEYSMRIRRRRRSYELRRAYGITIEEYETLLKEQGNVCACCGTATPGHKGKFVVDHCHLSGNVRGLLCNNCNQALGLMRDSIGYGLSLVAYLVRAGGVEHYAGCQPYIAESAKVILDALAKNGWRREARPQTTEQMTTGKGDPSWN